uniref:USP domain-containing protein n=1 Tax=Ciona savignyi TaxID=51511 RepID=H2Z7T1_CIOSA
MAGLVNMGNTCYMNSIIQALFMAEEFRRLMLIDVRQFPLKSVSKSLERTFAFLLKTKREAYRPVDMVGCSTPAWFTSGAQQDCSEYVKHLIDVLSSEYKEHFQESAMSTAGQSTLSNAESPATLPVRRNSESETSIYNLFHGKLRTSIKCLTCDFISMREESFLDLALPLNKAHEREIPVPGKGGSEMGLDPNPDAAPQPVTQESENVPMDTERGTSAFVEGNETVFQGQAVQVEEDFEEEEM